MTKQKRKILKVAIITAMILLLCTVVSQIIHTKLLPIVDTVKPSRNIIITQSVTAANVTNVTEQAYDTAATQWVIKEVYVSPGDVVQQGDQLFKIDMLEYTARLREMQADIQQQQNNLNAIDWTGGDRLVLNTKLESTKLEYQRMVSAGTPRGGIVTASCAGAIQSLFVAPGTVLNAFEKYIQYELPTQQQRIVWSLSKEAGSRYSEVSTVTIKATNSNQTAEGLPLVLNIIERNQHDDFTWSYQAELPPDVRLDGAQNYQAVMVLKQNTYDYVVPRSCVQTDAAGQSYIYIITQEEGLFNQEYKVSAKNIIVLDQDNLHAAIQPQSDGESLNGCNIVVSTTKPIEAGGEVDMKAVA